MEGERRLRTVIFCLTEEWRGAAQELAETLKQSQISVSFSAEAEVRHLVDKMQRSGSREDVEKALQTLVLTDSKELARELRRIRISGEETGCFPCIGCVKEERGYFEGVGLATNCPEAFSVQELEEYLFHCNGWPVTVAVTERLILREITEDDVNRLYEISTQGGMEYLQDGIDENFFRKENLLSYIKNIYRLQGYGLWSVFLKSSMPNSGRSLDNAAPKYGVLIGCCGLADTKAADGRIRMELQYMLDKAYHRQGYGTEMCRAALNYVFARTDQQEVWLRIHEENGASVKLAQKLGFVCDGTDLSGIRYFRKEINGYTPRAYDF